MDQNVLNWINSERCGTLTEADREALAKWRAADPANEVAYLDLAELWDVLPKADPAWVLPDADTTTAWARFESRLPAAEPVKAAPVRPIFHISLLLKVAAVAMLAMVTLWFLFRPGGEKPLHYAALSGEQTISLADGSEVVLRRDGVLTVLPSLDKDVTPRQVLLEGEAFFQVTSHEGLPFTVQAGDLLVTVLGTAFYVSAPASGRLQEVLVSEGRVSVQFKGSDRSVILSAGESVAFMGTDAPLEPGVVDLNRRAWHTGILVFQGTPLSDVLAALEEHFGMVVRLSDTSMAHCRFTGRIARNDGKDALRALAATMEMTLKTSPDGVHYLTGGNCH